MECNADYDLIISNNPLNASICMSTLLKKWVHLLKGRMTYDCHPHTSIKPCFRNWNYWTKGQIFLNNKSKQYLLNIVSSCSFVSLTSAVYRKVQNSAAVYSVQAGEAGTNVTSRPQFCTMLSRRQALYHAIVEV